jgi:hypothetical protein
MAAPADGHKTPADLRNAVLSRLSERADGKPQTDAHDVQDGGRDYESRAVGEARSGIRHFDAVRVTVKDGEHPDKRHSRDHRQTEAERNGNAQSHNRQADAGFNVRKLDASHSKRPACGHHRNEGERNEPKGTSSEVNRKNANGDHCKNVIDPAGWVDEAVSDSLWRIPSGLVLKEPFVVFRRLTEKQLEYLRTRRASKKYVPTTAPVRARK